jgi:uncharacterized protein (DUF486 family)
MVDFPVTPEATLTVVGIAFVTYVVTALLKQYLPDWRFTNLLAWGIAFVVAFVAAVGVAGWNVYKADLFKAFMTALFGVGLATFGHEFMANMLGYFGVGTRK